MKRRSSLTLACKLGIHPLWFYYPLSVSSNGDTLGRATTASLASGQAGAA